MSIFQTPSGGSGFQPGQTAFFRQTSDGSPPPGWAWAPGFGTNSYDQGFSAADSVRDDSESMNVQLCAGLGGDWFEFRKVGAPGALTLVIDATSAVAQSMTQHVLTVPAGAQDAYLVSADIDVQAGTVCALVMVQLSGGGWVLQLDVFEASEPMPASTTSLAVPESDAYQLGMSAGALGSLQRFQPPARDSAGGAFRIVRFSSDAHYVLFDPSVSAPVVRFGQGKPGSYAAPFLLSTIVGARSDGAVLLRTAENYLVVRKLHFDAAADAVDSTYRGLVLGAPAQSHVCSTLTEAGEFLVFTSAGWFTVQLTPEDPAAEVGVGVTVLQVAGRHPYLDVKQFDSAPPIVLALRSAASAGGSLVVHTAHYAGARLAYSFDYLTLKACFYRRAEKL